MAKKAITYLHATQVVFSINAKPSLLKMKGHTKPVPDGQATNNLANNSIQPTHTDINLIASSKTRCSCFQNNMQTVNNSVAAIYPDRCKPMCKRHLFVAAAK